MQYCNQCRVQIRGNTDRCVLCGNLLNSGADVRNSPRAEAGRSGKEVFPEIPPAYERHLAIRILVFISFAAIVASFAMRMIFPSGVNWPLYVVLGLVSMWLGLIIVIRKGYHIPKTIMWQVTVVSILSVIWDKMTGWRGWSIDYVIPAVFVAAVLVMYIIAKITKLSIRDYITYALLDGLLGILPVLFIVFDWVSVYYPAIICAAASITFLSAIFIFQGDNIRKELNKRMHI